MSHLLLVEDDAGVAELLALAMRSLGHTVTVAPDGYAGLDALDKQTVDVVLLDVMMPGIDGFETARRMRARSQVPIVMLTARSDPVDIVAGLECGADDYVTKPAEPRVLDARVKAILRRATPAPEDVVVHRIGDLVLDPGARKLSRGASEVPLTPTEFDVLAELVGGLPLSLVAPLGSDDHHGWHECAPWVGYWDRRRAAVNMSRNTLPSGDISTVRPGRRPCRNRSNMSESWAAHSAASPDGLPDPSAAATTRTAPPRALMVAPEVVNSTRVARPEATSAFSLAAASCARCREAGSAPKTITGPSSQATAARPDSTTSTKKRGE